MSIFGKLAFWKKRDDAAIGLGIKNDLGLNLQEPQLGNDLGLNLQENNGFQENNLGLDTQQNDQQFMAFGTQNYKPKSSANQATILRQTEPIQGAQGYPQQMQQQQQSTSSMMYNKDIEMISVKLDAARASLDAINQRLTNVERILQGQGQQQQSDQRRRLY